MADSMKKSYKVSGQGVLEIEKGKVSITCEDKGKYDLSVVLKDLDGCGVKFNFSYDEDYVDPIVDEETGEIL